MKFTTEEQLKYANDVLDNMGAEPDELLSVRITRLTIKLATRVDMPWQYEVVFGETQIPLPPEGKGWELLSTSYCVDCAAKKWVHTWRRK